MGKNAIMTANQARPVRELIAGGVFGDIKNPDDVSLVADRGKGAKLWTIDGREFTDYELGSGPMVLGHAHPVVVEAIREQAGRGTHFHLMNEAALGLASRVAQHVPCAESLKFVSDGAQATFFSLRFARAFTGRNKILKFAGAYHGHHDYAQHAQRDATGGAGIAERADTAGIPQQISSQVLVCPFNDLGSVEKLVAEFGSDLAAIIVEPIQRAILPAPGFLQGLRAICDRIGAMLVFDEIVTGFRVSLGGAQQLYGVTPDLCALGKIMGGGLPIAAVAGRRDILELSIPQRKADGRSIFLSGTLNGNPLCCAAGVATLDNLIACRGVEKIARAGERLRQGFEENARRLSIPFQMIGHPAFAQPVFTDRPIRSYADFASANRDISRRFGIEMIKLGQNVLLGGKFYISTEHNDEIVSQTVEAGYRAMKTMQEAGVLN